MPLTSTPLKRALTMCGCGCVVHEDVGQLLPVSIVTVTELTISPVLVWMFRKEVANNYRLIIYLATPALVLIPAGTFILVQETERTEHLAKYLTRSAPFRSAGQKSMLTWFHIPILSAVLSVFLPLVPEGLRKSSLCHL